MKITVRNRLPILIRERKLRSASEFGRRMSEAGLSLSSAQASRYMKDDPPPFTVEFIEHTCNVLGCLPNDLFDLTIQLEAGEQLDPALVLPRGAVVRSSPPAHAPSPPPAPEAKPRISADITGPKVSPFPKRRN